MNKVKFSIDMKCTERSNMSKILPCCFSSLKVLPQVWEKTRYCSYTDQLKGICQHCNFYVSGGRILTEMEQNFTSKMILLKNVSAFKSINTRKKKFIYIHVYNETWWYSTKNIQSKYGIFSKDTVCVWII